jgi:hypothetical protein
MNARGLRVLDAGACVRRGSITSVELGPHLCLCNDGGFFPEISNQTFLVVTLVHDFWSPSRGSGCQVPTD